ncbi:hypothetical protein, partial [Nocardioides aestuarii]
MRLRTVITSLIAPLVALGLVLASTTPASAGRAEGPAAAKDCRKGGWRDLVRHDGSTFRNAGQCVRYSKQQGNSSAAKACQKGGWRDLKREDGTRFRNTGHCVSYAAHGGTLTALATAVEVSFTPTSDPLYCNVLVGLVDFEPDTTYDVVIDVVGSFPDGTTFDQNISTETVTTDATGAATLSPYSFLADGVYGARSIRATVDGVTDQEA